MLLHKTSIATLAIAVIVGSVAAPTSKVLQARQASVNVLWQDKNSEEWRAICSGSFVELGSHPNELTLVSAGHCVDDYPKGSYAAKLSDGQSVDLVLQEHIFAWPADYAVFTVANKDKIFTEFIRPLKVGKPFKTVGSKAFMWSGPIGTDINYYEGYYSGPMTFVDYPTDVDNMAWVIIDSAPGSSGTVMLNSSGEAVGILVAGFGTDTKLFGAMLSDLPK